MKRLLLTLILLASCFLCSAQWISDVRMDDGFYAFRHGIAPGFHCGADDYVQYSPGAAMLIIKACGVEGRSTWGNMIVSSAFAVALEAAMVKGIKWTVGRTRPNMSANDSFPSGHAATSFMTATLLQKEYGWKYPWIGFGGYAIASGISFSRIMNNMHWGTDVMAGALLGIVSGELGYWLGSLIFKEKGLKSGFTDGPGWRERIADCDGETLYSRMPCELGLYFSTAAWLRPSGNASVSDRDADGRNTALSFAGISGSIPFAEHLGAGVRLGISGKEYAATGDSGDVLSRSNSASFEAMAGIYADWNFFSLAFVRPHAYIGAGFGKGFAWAEADDVFSCRPQCMAGVDLGLQITDNYAFKFIADYGYSFRNWSGVMLGGGAAFCF